MTTRGVVVGDHEGAAPALRGFYLQAQTGDGDVSTSDGIFVFNGGNQNLVSVGDVVRVTGNAGENQGQTQISSSIFGIAACGTGSVDPTDVNLPVATSTTLERYEGMLVRTPQTLYVTEHFQLGRFGQVVLSSGGRLVPADRARRPGRGRDRPAGCEQPEPADPRRLEPVPEPRPDRVRSQRRSAERVEHAPRWRHADRSRRGDDVHLGRKRGEPRTPIACVRSAPSAAVSRASSPRIRAPRRLPMSVGRSRSSA